MKRWRSKFGTVESTNQQPAGSSGKEKQMKSIPHDAISFHAWLKKAGASSVAQIWAQVEDKWWAERAAIDAKWEAEIAAIDAKWEAEIASLLRSLINFPF
jgi:hypothetical protein